MVVYKTTNLINGKIYVGQDLHNIPKYLGSGKIFKQALKKYGEENFIKEILEYCGTKEQLNEREIYWIEELKARERNIGYNISSGGVYGDTLTNNPNREEIIEKIRKSNSGKVRTDETKDKIRKSLIGHIVLKKTRDKIGETRKERNIKPSQKNIEASIKRLKQKLSGENNINAKIFYLTSPAGESFITNGNLPSFCLEHKINVNVLRNWVNKGKIPVTSRKTNDIRENTNEWEIKTEINIDPKNDKYYYILISPTNKEYKLYNGLRRFCKDNNIWYWTLIDNVDNGKISSSMKCFSEERTNTNGWEIRKVK